MSIKSSLGFHKAGWFEYHRWQHCFNKSEHLDLHIFRPGKFGIRLSILLKRKQFSEWAEWTPLISFEVTRFGGPSCQD